MSSGRVGFPSEERTQNNNLVGVSPGKGRCRCELSDPKQVAGLVTLVLASVALLGAIFLASGIVGGGSMGLVAAGVGLGSVVGYIIAAYFLLPRCIETETKTLGDLKKLQDKTE